MNMSGVSDGAFASASASAAAAASSPPQPVPPADSSSPSPSPSNASASSNPPLDPLRYAQTVELLKDAKLRFILELEFVELLASPHYLHYLAYSHYFSDASFLRYLSYLQYWHAPTYAKHVSHPHALAMLDLLQHESFRSALSNPQFIGMMHEQQFWHWRSFRYNRFREMDTKRTNKNETEREMEMRQQEQEQEQKRLMDGDGGPQMTIAQSAIPPASAMTQ